MAEVLGHGFQQVPEIQLATGAEGGLRQAVTERLAAHRDRRAVAQAMPAQAIPREDGNGSRRAVSRVREAVAARYEQSVSYHEFLEAEAERALQQARAEAEIAARNAVAMAEAKMQLMAELEHWNCPLPGPREVVREEAAGEMLEVQPPEPMQVEPMQVEPMQVEPMPLETVSEARVEVVADEQKPEPAGLTVQLYDTVVPDPSNELKAGEALAAGVAEAVDEELLELEQEIEFRLAPKHETYVVDALPIPGNLIEFPRQLVAPRKARPRLAEGPLREDAPAEPQLRIFEVEAEQISVAPAADSNAAPEWQSLLLDATTAAAQTTPIHAQLQFTLQPQTASLELRLMAAAVDLFWIGAAFVSFAAVAVELVGQSLRLLPKPLVGASAAGVLVVLYVLYQMLFFSLTGTTPGMRYARIGLCTFGDRNPSRKAMRRRVLATLLAACPLGLGLAWACLDEERLGWHDRMSRMYQRAY